MWSLPDIKSMNERAVANAEAIQKEADGAEPHVCDYCDQPAEHHYLWHDIFSDDAKGVVHLCDRHDDGGVIYEDHFDCDGCGRLMVDHYTWERYRVELDGETLCLACAAERYFADDGNAVDPAKLEQVVEERGLPLISDDGKVLNLYAARHVLAVKQPLPKGVKFIENFENANNAGVFDTRGILETIKAQTKPVFVVLDAAYQFSVSIGLYVKEGA